MRIVAPLSGLLVLAACSSGGSSPTPTPTPAPANRAPAFTSGTTANPVENTTAAYQAAATDPDGNPVTFTIAGGADSALFSITPAGALSFLAPPNFEAPRDAGADNVYDVQIAASDGALSATLNLALTVTNSREGIAVKRVGTGFNQPIYLAPIPGSADVFVAEKTGGIWRLTPSTGAKTLALTAGNLSTDGERGLLGIAVPSNFATSRQLIAHATAPDGTIELRLYIVTGNVNAAYNNLVTIPHAGANNHNGGWVGFGPDGDLFDAVGDGGGSGDPENDAQNSYSRLGKILRLSPSGNTYVATPTNPFSITNGGGDPYVFALGLRNPFRCSFGPNGGLYIGDVGQDKFEEVNLMSPFRGAMNFGWHYREGLNAFTGTPPPGTALTAPVAVYPHGTGAKQGNSIIGGYVYRGPVTSLVGSYVFADYVNGHIWTVPSTLLVQSNVALGDNFERRNLDFTPDAGTIDQLVSFGEDSAGNLYIVDITGEIFEVVPG